ncbi:MAG: 50S ribosomal protein L25 [Candidatus Lightella neohaematopini]|nr:50S ribosomal protein L25 [Candidatus Lightella neohaematopini]MCV2529030.1 50S ribosomal protein L25 [Candidatus Lightella neohaematopini]
MFEINVKTRLATGRINNKKLRRLNKIPAIIRDDNFKLILIQLDHNSFLNFLDIKGYNSDTLLCLNFNNKKYKVKIKSLQLHPFKRLVMHIDFQKINNENY